jgi:hypothetical protein
MDERTQMLHPSPRQRMNLPHECVGQPNGPPFSQWPVLECLNSTRKFICVAERISEKMAE